MVSDEGLRALSNFKILTLDGTFDSAPDPFKQIFCINVLTDTREVLILSTVQLSFLNPDRSIPVVWALLSNKSKLIYREGVFRPLQTLMADANFGEVGEKVIVTDFESAIYKAFQEVFEDSVCYGDNFHFRQVICCYLNLCS